MQKPSRPDDILSVPSQDFAPLPLCLDDALPVSMVLLLGFRYRLDPVALRSALATALQAFPHLGGRLHLNLQPFQVALVPGGREVQLEWIRSDSSRLETLETLDQETLAARFAPSAAAAARSPMQALQAPLLQLRLTWLPEEDACVLGVMASHLALDGTGMALFLAHVTAAMRGGTAPAVIHDRRCTFPDPLPTDGTLPPFYREVPQLSLAMAQDQDPLAATEATVFSIHAENLDRLLGQASFADARLFLAAQLCREVAARQPGRRMLAQWCNARGLGHVPRNYTGNAGCYAHLPLEALPLEGGDTESLYRGLKQLITSRGFAGINDAYARLKAAEAAGRYAFWEGPGDNLLSLNLVPHIRNPADFGHGSPEFGLLLTRNVSGLRLFSSPDGDRLIVEACLASGLGEALIAACERLGLRTQVWHRPGIQRAAS